MKDEYIVNRAICQCKFGTTPGFLKVTDNQAVCMNGKLAATDKTLGNVFEGAGFTMCKKSWPPRPCTPSLSIGRGRMMVFPLTARHLHYWGQARGRVPWVAQIVSASKPPGRYQFPTNSR